MHSVARRIRIVGVTAIGTVVLAGAAAALAGTSITKHRIESVSVPAGQTRTLTVPFPDALEYGNARYSGRAEIRAPLPGTKGRTPQLGKVKILEAQSVLGGSDYQARARNSNGAGTAAVRLVVTATTLEPLPHS